jgi:general secretion pathway protein B
MSFILDALKKSETERQQQTGAEFSNVPSSSGEPQSFKWLWILALLLLVNVVVLLGLLLREEKVPDTPPDTPAPVELTPVEQSQPAASSFEDRVAEARQNQPAPDTTTAEATPLRTAGTAPVETPPQTDSQSGPRLMTIDELRLNGTLALPELHIDIHVYADDPAERFVFINMKKHREKSQLDEGPVVSEITTDGVILKHQGSTFLLPRE